MKYPLHLVETHFDSESRIADADNRVVLLTRDRDFAQYLIGLLNSIFHHEAKAA
jgi:hypothetical protein